MGQGLFILLCVLALIIGTRARNTKALSPKSIKARNTFKRILSIFALSIIGVISILLIPTTYEDIRIALDTRFTSESFLSLGVLIAGIYTFITILRKLIKQKETQSKH